MAVSDIRDQLRKNRLNQMTDTTELLEEGLSMIVQQGVKGILDGSIKIQDMNDIQRAWTIMKEVGAFNEVVANAGQQSGQLPELKAREALALGIPEPTEDAQEGESETIDLSALDDDAIQQMAIDFANAINNDNVNSMDS